MKSTSASEAVFSNDALSPWILKDAYPFFLFLSDEGYKDTSTLNDALPVLPAASVAVHVTR
jgi:hypothetical protein